MSADITHSSSGHPVIRHSSLLECLPSEVQIHVISCNSCASLWNSFASRASAAIRNNNPIVKEEFDLERGTFPDVSSESILEEAQRVINGPRAESYGPPIKNFTDIAYGWSKLLNVDIKPEQVALCMIWLKMMRFQNGKPDRDSIVDIAGYAGTIEKALPELSKKEGST